MSLTGGIIAISGQYFTPKKEKFKKIAIWHEFCHFFNYLIRINAENWEFGRYYSNRLHNEYDSENMNNKIEQINYYLDSEEFKQLADTYISQLKILYTENCKNPDDNINKLIFFQVLMNICQIPVKFCDLSKYKFEPENTFQTALYYLFSIPDIKNFFYYTYKDSISENETNVEHNKWTVLLKWLQHEFNK